MLGIKRPSCLLGVDSETHSQELLNRIKIRNEMDKVDAFKDEMFGDNEYEWHRFLERIYDKSDNLNLGDCIYGPNNYDEDVKEALDAVTKILEATYKPFEKEDFIDSEFKGVKKQDYYFRNGIEVKEVIQSVFQFFGDDLDAWEAATIYNVLKYLMRYKFKGNSKQDLEKIHVCVDWLLEKQE